MGSANYNEFLHKKTENRVLRFVNVFLYKVVSLKQKNKAVFVEQIIIL